MTTSALSADIASAFARIALANVVRKYPHRVDHVMVDADDLRAPEAMHPIFYGSFDWHSCVHNYWLLCFLYNRFPEMVECAAIETLFNDRLTQRNVEGEMEYFQKSTNVAFSRPYGWAWLLKLYSELASRPTVKHKAWTVSVEPFAEYLLKRLSEFVIHSSYPVRTGAHNNTAFAIVLATDAKIGAFAEQSLFDGFGNSAKRWYFGDVGYHAYEPNEADFLSPCLVEAVCMLRVVSREEFITWFNKFLPSVGEGQPRALFEPVVVNCPDDPHAGHLNGLNLSRAWCWRLIASSLPSGYGGRELIVDSAQRHLDAAITFVQGNYMREHWLATFAALALSTPA
jgi:hypothetical protein